MNRYDPYLRWVDQQHDRMCQLVTRWANINSGSRNIGGLARLSADLAAEFEPLGGTIRKVALPAQRVVDAAGRFMDLPVAEALHIIKRPEAKIRIFLCIHMDTVFEPNHPFQTVYHRDAKSICGPGVVDAKGGLCVMLVALQALELSRFAGQIGWEVLINPDEEIGSPGSIELLKECAGRNQVGMLYEPTFADGALVAQRKGSGNFDVVIRGRAAHAGRDFQLGRNAMHAAGALIVRLEQMNGAIPGVTVNVGQIDGGGPVNVVPDLAIVRFNVRVPTPQLQQEAEAELARILEDVGQRDGIRLELTGGFSSPPKIMDGSTLQLLEQIKACGQEIGLPLSWRDSGGASDGNKLAAAGLPVVDTLGPQGGNLHSAEEYLLLDSLTQRAKLSALLLMKFGSSELSVPG